MTSNVNFAARPRLQLVVAALCAVKSLSQFARIKLKGTGHDFCDPMPALEALCAKINFEL